MHPSPYDDLASVAFWRTGVAQVSPTDLERIYKKKWEIKPRFKIATAGSCFAQHITKGLREKGFNVLDLEPAPPGLPEGLHTKYGFSMYSCRYGNIYTAQQLLQLTQEVAGTFSPSDFIWQKDGRFYDGLRPAVEPDGLNTAEEVLEHRNYHISRVRLMLQSLDVLVFTLGLTEAWIHKPSGTVYPMAPGTMAGSYDESIHLFKNYTFLEVLSSLKRSMAVIRSIRKDRSLPRLLLTVSPVPLTATASGDHVLAATVYSKSVLRAAAGHLAKVNRHVDYFPSFEIITNQSARGSFYADNLRSVKAEGVDVVMRTFFSEHRAVRRSSGLSVGKLRQSAALPAERINSEDVQCEESLLEAFN